MPNQITPEQIRDAVAYAFTATARAHKPGIADDPNSRFAALEAIADRAEDVAELINKIP